MTIETKKQIIKECLWIAMFTDPDDLKSDMISDSLSNIVDLLFEGGASKAIDELINIRPSDDEMASTKEYGAKGWQRR